MRLSSAPTSADGSGWDGPGRDMNRPHRKLWAEQTLEILERGRYTNLSGETVELAAAATVFAAHAQTAFPSSKPISLVVPFASV